MTAREAFVFWFMRGIAQALGGLVVVGGLLAVCGAVYLVDRWRRNRL